MDLLETVEVAKSLARDAQHHELEQHLACIERQVLMLVRERNEANQERASLQKVWGKIRHDVAQPLTTVQVFLELLPEILDCGEGNSQASLFLWQKHHHRAVEAARAIPEMLTRNEK